MSINDPLYTKVSVTTAPPSTTAYATTTYPSGVIYSGGGALVGAAGAAGGSSGYYSTYSVGAAGAPYSNDITMSGTVHAGDVKIDGISMKDTLKAIQDRLAILDKPTPEKLEKFAALRDLYDQYKMMEALCYEEKPTTK